MGKKAVLIAIPVILLLSDLIIRDEVFPGFKTLQWSFYLLSFIYTILLYSALIIGLRFLYFYGNKGLYWTSLLLAAFFYTACMAGSYGYYAYTGIMPNFFVFSFLFQEPLNSWTIFWGGLTGRLIVLACLLYLLIASLLYLSTKVLSQKFRFRKILRLASIFCFYSLLHFFITIPASTIKFTCPIRTRSHSYGETFITNLQATV